MTDLDETRESVSLHGVDYIPAPVDANGETIRVGDVLMTIDDGPFEVREIALDESGTWLVRDRMGVAYDVRGCTHYRKPTVEDVLRKFLGDCEDAVRKGYGDVPSEIYAEYAKKLRLREES